MAEFSFILPPGPLSREGGGAYVSALAAALAEAGHGVDLGGKGSAGATRVIDGAALCGCTLGQMEGAVGLIHHTSPLADAKDLAAIQPAERERLRLLRRVIATSDLVRDRLAGEFAVPPGRIEVVRPGVPDAPRSTGSGGPGCRLLGIGALVPRKGHTVLLRALARLFDLDWSLVIVGNAERDPAHAAALREQAEAAGIRSRVQFAGSLEPAALEREWRRADMFALATEWEGYSAPVAEALRRGLPVAVADGGAAAELAGPEFAVVVHPGDEVGLSKALRRVIFDTGLRAAMADAAWQAGRALPGWPAQAARFIEATLP